MSVAAIAMLMLLGTLAMAGVQAEPAGGTWDGGLAIQKDLNDSNDPFVAQSSNGNKIVVWIETDSDSNDYLYFSMYTPMTGWSWPSVLAGSDSMYYPQVGMSDNGSAIVCWVGYSTEYHLYSITYISGMGWGEVFDHGKTDSYDWRQLRLSMNGDGDAVLAHESIGTTTRSVEIWTYDAGMGWETDPDVLQTVPIAEDFYGIYATLSESGLAATIWSYPSGDNVVMVSTRTAAGTWELPVEIDTDLESLFWLRVGIDDSTGECMATYLKSVDVYSIAYYSVTEGGSWSAPLPVAGLNNTYSLSQNMVMNQDGTALLVTTDSITPTYNVNATMYIDGEWTPVVSIVSELTGLFYPEVAIDDAGRAVVTFTIDNDRVAAVYTPDDGWTEALPIELKASGSTYTVASVSMVSGEVLIGYSSYSSGNVIWASTYAFPDTEPPMLQVDQATGSETDRPLFEITGTTDPGAQIDVNGKLAAVSSSGEFSILVELSAGENSLVVTATDDAGNSIDQTIVVTYNDPLPGLADQIEDQQGEIEDKQAAIDQLQDDLDAANDKISELESTSMMYGILGIIGLIIAVVALALVFVRREG